MVRWKCCLLLATLLLLSVSAGTEDEDEDDNEEEDDEDNRDGGDNDNDDDEQTPTEQKKENFGRKAPAILPTQKPVTVTRTIKKRPLECYVCAYKADSPLRSCLDPSKYRIHTMSCHSADDKCFTSVTAKGETFESVVRGCRSGCLGSPDTTCCELNRCNSQPFAMPIIAPRSLTSKTNKSIPPSVFFFVTILLVLQTVVKVTLV